VLERTVESVSALNDDQWHVYKHVMHAVNNGNILSKLFLLNGPGRTGKSFLLDKILTTVCLDGKIALAMPLNGIAVVLLMGGRSAHC
jgi:hypothetical protein